jgi:translation initiation factor SUI1
MSERVRYAFHSKILTRFASHFADIRVQQRNSRKTHTTIQGLASDLDLKRILKAFKKVRLIAPC